MFRGVLEMICLASKAGEPIREVAEAHAVPGRGLEGDRYFDGCGTWSNHPGSGREVTLIEIEAIDAVKREAGIELAPHSARRNLVTRGVPLNHLVDRQFRVGEVVLRGLRLCEPCSYLEGITQPGLKAALAHRGGLRAIIVESGVIRAGDTIEGLIP
jgi:MOSC domain-containing protein YiiM